MSYESTAADAVSDDSNGVSDAFVFDRQLVDDEPGEH